MKNIFVITLLCVCLTQQCKEKKPVNPDLLLRKSVREFNTWRSENTTIKLNFTNKDYSKLNLKGANFTSADLTGAKFLGTDLTGANFQNSRLLGANFSSAILRQANFNGARLNNTIFFNADLTMSRLNRSQPVNKVNLTNAVLKAVDFRGMNITLFLPYNADMQAAIVDNRWKSSLQRFKIKNFDKIRWAE